MPHTKPRPKGKFNLTIGEKCRKKLEHLARLENRSASNLIEEMTHERWGRLADKEELPFSKIVADIATHAKLNLANQNELYRFRKAVLDQLLRDRPGGGALV